MPQYQHALTPKQLGQLPEDDQREVMETWFRSRYEDPAERTPYDGGYVWIWGGPYDAEEELRSEFEEVVPEKIIEDLAESLSQECSDWAPVPSDDDYDHSLLAVVSANADSFPTLKEALGTVARLMKIKSDTTDEQALNRLLYANVIAALETYLSDSFINRVVPDQALLRKFLETTPEFQKRTIPYSDVFKAADDAREEAKKYLLDVVWHNLAKVQAMYRDTLGIDFGDKLAAVARAIPKRHDIVHRNGKDKDGVAVAITKKDVAALSAAVQTLADDVKKKLDAGGIGV